MTVEEMFIDIMIEAEYYKGFGSWSNDSCILMQVYAELLYC